MTIVFYHDDLKAINLKNIYTIGASGTVSSLMWLANGLSELKHKITILNRSKNIEIDNINFIQTVNENDLKNKLHKIADIDIFIAVGGAGEIFHTLDLKIPVKIFWLHNYISNLEQNKFNIDNTSNQY